MDGSYLLLDLTADGVAFCLIPQTGPSTAFLLLCLAAGVVLIVILILILCVVRKKRKRRPAAVSDSAQ